MSTESCCDKTSCCEKTKWCALGVAVLGTFLIVGFLVHRMEVTNGPAPVTAARKAERVKNLQEMRNAETAGLENLAWQDKDKGIVHLPVKRALELVGQEWKNPAEGRAILLKRLEKAVAKLPEKPSQFE